LDGPLHGGARPSSRGTDEGCCPVAVGVDGGPTRCTWMRQSSWRDVGLGGRPEAAGGIEVFTAESGWCWLRARQRRHLRIARVNDWSLTDGDRRCRKEDATPMQSAT
jgi:hypothetical protein